MVCLEGFLCLIMLCYGILCFILQLIWVHIIASEVVFLWDSCVCVIMCVSTSKYVSCAFLFCSLSSVCLFCPILTCFCFYLTSVYYNSLDACVISHETQKGYGLKDKWGRVGRSWRKGSINQNILHEKTIFNEKQRGHESWSGKDMQTGLREVIRKTWGRIPSKHLPLQGQSGPRLQWSQRWKRMIAGVCRLLMVSWS